MKMFQLEIGQSIRGFTTPSVIWDQSPSSDTSFMPKENMKLSEL